MNKTGKLAVAAIALALLSGCASTRSGESPKVVSAPGAEQQVSRPTQSYGSLGGYRYRRFVAVTISAS